MHQSKNKQQSSQKAFEGGVQSIFGVGDVFKGEFNLTGPLRVDGTLQGEVITSSWLHISRSGKGGGRIEAQSIQIGGEFIGDLYATDHITLLYTAYVRGNIVARSLKLEEGAFYSGECRVSPVLQNKTTVPEQKDTDPVNESKDIKLLSTQSR